VVGVVILGAAEIPEAIPAPVVVEMILAAVVVIPEVGTLAVVEIPEEAIREAAAETFKRSDKRSLSGSEDSRCGGVVKFCAGVTFAQAQEGSCCVSLL
jgi:hypothetical protein